MASIALLCAILVATGISAPPALAAGNAASDWAVGHYSRVRLVWGAKLGDDGQTRRLAGIEVQLAEGWKTYWRTASGSGGFPPVFNWSGSGNLKRVRVLYPAPQRFVAKEETTIGYKHEVVFPLEVVANDPNRPVDLKLQMDFGVCTDFCVPAEADLALTLPIEAGGAGLAPIISRYLDLVPGPAGAVADSPVVEQVKIAAADDKPVLRISTRFAGGAENRDIFIEASDGTYVPSATPVEHGTNGEMNYEVVLRSKADLDALKATELVVTLVSSAGQSETRLRLE